MPQTKSLTKIGFRLFAAFLGLALLAMLVLRTGPQIIWSQVHAIGFGMAVIVVLGGVALFIRSWAWRMTLMCDVTALPWSRSFAVCLVSEALGQLGAGGKVLGEGMRISLVKSSVPIANAIPSAAIDGGLHVASSILMTLSGILATLSLAPVSGNLRLFAFIFVTALMTVLVLAGVSIGKGWELMGKTARAIGHVPRLQSWISRKQPVIDSSERNLLNFFHEAPGAFCAALFLNFLWQVLAVLEVYLILHFIGAGIAVPGAFVLEGLTKVINLVGLFNPGNIGTYEGGNMLITKLFGVPGTVGLTLGLCRRARALFWAFIGAACLMFMSKPAARTNSGVNPDPTPVVRCEAPGLLK